MMDSYIPSEDGWPTSSSTRRPADIWLPVGVDIQSRGSAIDFAVTSGLRNDIWRQTLDDPSSVFERYENFKRRFQSTDQQCNSAGFAFHPFIFEAHSGSWSPLGRKICSHIAKSVATVENTSPEIACLRIAQRISIALHRENARAILKPQAMVAAPEPCAEVSADFCDQLQ